MVIEFEQGHANPPSCLMKRELKVLPMPGGVGEPSLVFAEVTLKAPPRIN